LDFDTWLTYYSLWQSLRSTTATYPVVPLSNQLSELSDILVPYGFHLAPRCAFIPYPLPLGASLSGISRVLGYPLYRGTHPLRIPQSLFGYSWIRRQPPMDTQHPLSEISMLPTCIIRMSGRHGNCSISCDVAPFPLSPIPEPLLSRSGQTCPWFRPGALAGPKN
jgi:hypothetical protein